MLWPSADNNASGAICREVDLDLDLVAFSSLGAHLCGFMNTETEAGGL